MLTMFVEANPTLSTKPDLIGEEDSLGEKSGTI
jgi:hypothetical protein